MNNGGDGTHTYNGAVLDNIYWMNVGEDAMTIKSSGTTTVRNIGRITDETTRPTARTATRQLSAAIPL